MPGEGAEQRFGAGGPMPPGAADDLLRKINSACRLSEEPIVRFPKSSSDPVVESAFAAADEELKQWEGQYAARAAQAHSKRESRPEAPSSAELEPEHNPTAVLDDPVPAKEQGIEDVIREAQLEGIHFRAKVPKSP